MATVYVPCTPLKDGRAAVRDESGETVRVEGGPPVAQSIRRGGRLVPVLAVGGELLRRAGERAKLRFACGTVVWVVIESGDQVEPDDLVEDGRQVGAA